MLDAIEREGNSNHDIVLWQHNLAVGANNSIPTECVMLPQIKPLVVHVSVHITEYVNKRRNTSHRLKKKTSFVCDFVYKIYLNWIVLYSHNIIMRIRVCYFTIINRALKLIAHLIMDVFINYERYIVQQNDLNKYIFFLVAYFSASTSPIIRKIPRTGEDTPTKLCSLREIGTGWHQG